MLQATKILILKFKDLVPIQSKKKLMRMNMLLIPYIIRRSKLKIPLLKVEARLNIAQVQMPKSRKACKATQVPS